MADRLEAVEWAWNTEFPVVPAHPDDTEGSWHRLYRDTRALPAFLASACELNTGRVEYSPERWAAALTISVDQVYECVGMLSAWDLAYSGGRIVDVATEDEAADNQGRRLTSATGYLKADYDARRGHWFGREL